jgi:hypothetical protein
MILRFDAAIVLISIVNVIMTGLLYLTIGLFCLYDRTLLTLS